MRSHSRWTVVLMLGLTACMSWRVVPAAPAGGIPAKTAVRIQQNDGTRVLLGSAELVGDSVIGWHRGTRIAMPTTAIQSVAVPEEHAWVGLGLGVGVVLMMAVMAGLSSSGL